jgi:hypothetical protein
MTIMMSIETITWIMTGKKYVSPLKSLKTHGIELTGLNKEKVENERKNIENILNNKYKPTAKTIKNFKWVVEILIAEMSKKFGYQEIAEKQIQKIRDNSQRKITTFLDGLNKIESDYDDVFQFPHLKNLFVYREIKQGFKILRECLNIYSETESENAVLDYLYNNEIFNQLNLKDSETFTFDDSDGIGGFNLNVTLYLIACIESEDNGKSLLSIVIKTMLLDIENGNFSENVPFKYYTDLCKKDSGLSFNKMAEILNVDDRTFDRYRAGKVAYPASLKKDLIYDVIVFIKGLFLNTIFLIEKEKYPESYESIKNIFYKYDEYYEIAKLRFSEYKNGVEVISSTPST